MSVLTTVEEIRIETRLGIHLFERGDIIGGIALSNAAELNMRFLEDEAIAIYERGEYE